MIITISFILAKQLRHVNTVPLELIMDVQDNACDFTRIDAALSSTEQINLAQFILRRT